MESATAKGDFSPAEDCRAQLARILNSADFNASERDRRFLSYVVEETLAGRGDRIKAYSVAIEVFGRDTSFDPQNDPIVRIEAGHLRRALERYYLTAGQPDPILITIPKGAYVPTFSRRPAPDAAEATPSGAATKDTLAKATGKQPKNWLVLAILAVSAATVAAVFAFQPRPTRLDAATPAIPRVLVERFDDLGRTEASATVASGLTQEVISQLSKFRDIVVVESADSPSTSPRYVLSGSVSMAANAFRLQARLVNRSDGTVLWADSYHGRTTVAEILQAQADIARNVVTSLAQTYGVIYHADIANNVDAPPGDWGAYSCTLSYYAYRASLDPRAGREARNCLEKTVKRFPSYATAWALLAQISIDELRFRFPFDPDAWQPEFDRILIMARHASELDPRNVRALHAEMSALYWKGEFEASRKVGEQAMAINPNDTDLMGSFGSSLALSGSWSDGCPLIEKARERSVGPFGYYESILALCSYFSGDYEQASMWIRKSPVPKNQLYHLIAAAIFGEAGNNTEADRERAWLEKNAPELVNNMRQEVYRRLRRPEDAATFLNSLRKAGLDFAV
ncbi:tetratricopeptide repeat protein [Mesorhizobium xinjiangense]|uniref:tetratricopeptide repeat protein n=1 Tax=Mesorhizobium xinjiangense TaxID=2678685 RepID=UPI0012ECE0B9|nr:hypothetical protein [Mesorhizobium xinjiangense]